jgi:hypothetical protein
MLPDALQETGRSQLLILDALASEGQRFGWKDFYKLWLLALYQKYPGTNIDFSIPGIRQDNRQRLAIDERVNVYSLRRAATALTRQVKPLAICIDEAPHMKKLGSGDRIAHQMDVIKSLTDETDTVIVLIGTYELLNMINQNGQQGRRSRDIHLRRYKFVDNDRRLFQTVLHVLANHIPLREKPNLEEIAEYLYQGCLGCFGILKPWLDQTLASVLVASKKTLTEKDLKKYELEKGKKLQIAKEIWEGEEELRRVEQECNDNLDRYLGLRPIEKS